MLFSGGAAKAQLGISSAARLGIGDNHQGLEHEWRGGRETFLKSERNNWSHHLEIIVSTRSRLQNVSHTVAPSQLLYSSID